MTLQALTAELGVNEADIAVLLEQMGDPVFGEETVLELRGILSPNGERDPS
jgi:hypothetical protein